MAALSPHLQPDLLHEFHGVLLRWFWRLVAPGHPRGWLDIHPVLDDAGTVAWLHCHGMERWNLPKIEIRGVPQDLLGAAHGILMAIAGYMKAEKRIAPDENIGGYFNGEGQAVVHRATMRQSPAPTPAHENMLCVVDLGEPADAGFPYRLFAVHLITMASGSSDAAKRESLLRRAVEIYPGKSSEASSDLEQSATNPNNFFGWSELGFALADQGRDEEAIAAFEQSVGRWPAGASKNAELFRQEIASGGLPPADKSRISRFWVDLDIPAVTAKVQEGWSRLR
jgi:hypothetical protein